MRDPTKLPLFDPVNKTTSLFSKTTPCLHLRCLWVTPFFVRITKALKICPFCIVVDRFCWFRFRALAPAPIFVDCEPNPDFRLLTETMMQSPINAYFFPDLLKILRHLTVLAPELSATFKILWCWIMTSWNQKDVWPAASRQAHVDEPKSNWECNHFGCTSYCDSCSACGACHLNCSSGCPSWRSRSGTYPPDIVVEHNAQSQGRSYSPTPDMQSIRCGAVPTLRPFQYRRNEYPRLLIYFLKTYFLVAPWL